MQKVNLQRQVDSDPDETRDIRELISEVVPYSKSWIRTPHELLGGLSPADLLDTEHGERVRELIRAIKWGGFS